MKYHAGVLPTAIKRNHIALFDKIEVVENKTPIQTSNPTIPNWILPAIVAIGVAGMGITGTLLWIDSQPTAPIAKEATSSSASTPSMSEGTGLPNSVKNGVGIPNPSDTKPSTPHEPPATLTAGMTPVQTSLTLGNWYYDHEAWPLAIQHYQETIAQGLDNADIRTDLGSAFRFSGQPQKGLEQYLLAQKKNPQHENSLFNQGGLYASEMKDSARAIAAWREYIKKFPNGQSVSQAQQLIAREQAQLKP